MHRPAVTVTGQPRPSSNAAGEHVAELHFYRRPTANTHHRRPCLSPLLLEDEVVQAVLRAGADDAVAFSNLSKVYDHV